MVRTLGTGPLVHRFALLAGLASAAGASAAVARQAREGGGEPAVRLIRSASGTKGRQEGTRYVIDDPRTVFSPAEDRQVLVYFEWEGRLGLHRCEGRWKDPSGKVVLVAPVDYEARSKRFGIYWTLAIPESVSPGLWALEATVDGEPAGAHAFEIAGRAASSSLSTAEIYARAQAAGATLERL
jgi:hypothetical protein